MPYTSEHKERSRERILASAAELFTQKGFDAISIDHVMKHAGMTRGAFYAHFSSKTDLYTTAILSSAQKRGAKYQQCVEESGPRALETLLEMYLSSEHATGGKTGCPLAFLATDVANRDSQVRKVYTRMFRGLANFVGRKLVQKSNAEDERKALAITVCMIGGVSVARALNNKQLAKEVLLACQDLCKTAANA